MPFARSQPIGAPRLARTNPLLRGMRHSWGTNVAGPGVAYDAVGRANGTFGVGIPSTTSGNQWVAGPNGYYLNYDDAGTGTVNSVTMMVGDANGSGSPGSNTFAFAFRCRLGALQNGIAIYGSSIGGIELQISAAGKIELVKQQVAALGASSGAVSAGVDVDIGISYDGNTVNYYINGAPAGSSSSSQTFNLAAQYFLGAAGNGERLPNGSRIYRLDIWDRPLVASEFKAWSANPWQIYEAGSDDDDQLASLTAPKQYTLAAAGGSFSVAGAGAGLRAARRMPAAAGSFAVAGVLASLLARRRLPAAPSSFALAGVSTRLAAARRLGADAGAFVLSGAAASLRAARALPAGPGGFAFAGVPVALFASRRMPAALGVFALGGGSAQIRAARKLQAGAGAFVMTGSSVSMTYAPAPGPGAPTYTLAAASGALGLTGAPAVLRVQRRLVAAPGELRLIGVPAAILAVRRLAGGVGSFNLQGQIASLRAARLFSVESGAFEFLGGGAQLRYSAQIDYARAPAGPGYAPQQHYNESRPAATSSPRPAATQRNFR